MNEPKRVQRKRTKGWKMPANTIYVGRPSFYGNSFTTAEEYRASIKDWPMNKILGFRRLLAGKNLACWCAPEKACHADVLLELANGDLNKFI